MTRDSTEHSTREASASVLVAEDDGPSGQFFKAALKGFGYQVDLRGDGPSALAQAREHRFDLLLLDCRMPHAGAVHILSALRDDPEAASHAAPALATSAEMDAALQHHLRQMGFADAIAKPVTVAALRSVVQAQIQPPRNQVLSECPTLLDDDAALATSGGADAVRALRELFGGELYRLADELDTLAMRPAELDERLHRLLASCGFCGADALAVASRRLKRQLDGGTEPSSAELQQFRDVLMATQQALELGS